MGGRNERLKWSPADSFGVVSHRRIVSTTVLASLVLAAACSAGDTQRAAICDRSVAIETAVLRVGALAKETKTMNAAVLQSQIDEDLSNLTAALDVAPESIVGDLSSVLSRLRNLYGALELLDWDAARFISDERLDEALATIGSVNTRRHLARLSGYVIEACDEATIGASIPPDSVVRTPPTSTSLPSTDDPIPTDEDLLTAHVAMGSAIAEAAGIAVSVEQAECLGREADLVSISDGTNAPDWKEKWSAAFRTIFPKCGLSVPDPQGP